MPQNVTGLDLVGGLIFAAGAVVGGVAMFRLRKAFVEHIFESQERWFGRRVDPAWFEEALVILVSAGVFATGVLVLVLVLVLVRVTLGVL